MAKITKHDTKQERETDNRKKCWICFFIVWNAVSIDDFLEDPSELVGTEVGGR